MGKKVCPNCGREFPEQCIYCAFCNIELVYPPTKKGAGTLMSGDGNTLRADNINIDNRSSDNSTHHTVHNSDNSTHNTTNNTTNNTDNSVHHTSTAVDNSCTSNTNNNNTTIINYYGTPVPPPGSIPPYNYGSGVPGKYGNAPQHNNGNKHGGGNGSNQGSKNYTNNNNSTGQQQGVQKTGKDYGWLGCVIYAVIAIVIAYFLFSWLFSKCSSFGEITVLEQNTDSVAIVQGHNNSLTNQDSKNTASKKNAKSGSSKNTTSTTPQTVSKPAEPEKPKVNLNTLSVPELIAYGKKTIGQEAIKAYQLAAEKGSEEANMLIGDIYFNGSGVETSRKTALSYYMKAQSLPHAMFRIGQMNYYGWGGLTKDKTTGKEWIEKAANAGSSEAQKFIEKEF